ncbi:MAG TPA: bifunctional 2-C-methyl-D-erythritol 4-phosphate cytidylyltransferase/2-C-methyl-D-erythritol 2,4-cyclodiphosphate synthase [Rhizomicrobium sp.]|jgi:2-C-methyl-D-erythritol 4-phosphate cytidylyltransferase/2-C-methyl-D-erythritol 2,4-cyclodiphosphate synthase|nr:bifunctional 2-C-methyl-D-erythritol 4-phosphate cytidylyltransferase/2-C-methyl-D-erythritol 2,4-cyclodiphosphate synthase [Rhizomicrobium sp.]
MSQIAALIVAAGKGERAGGAVPKQFQPLLGQSVLRRSVAAFAALPEIGEIQIVTTDERWNEAEAAVDGLRCAPFARGGATRQDSVRNGLEALVPVAPDFVLIHDAARPLVSPSLIRRVIAALADGAAAAIPVLPVSDSLKRSAADGWMSVPRDDLYRAQTPQGFVYKRILAAHREFRATAVTDDTAVAELAGMAIKTVAGEDSNLKITTEDDFRHAARLLRGTMEEFRTGQGFDAHRFVPGDHVWLCGVKIAHDAALEGHSDADAGLHALTDAILGAIGAGDIGRHFPPTEEKWRGAASSLFLSHAAQLVRQAGGAIVHCDVTIICERPKIAPHRDAMRARIAEILQLEVSRVSVKATTTEGMGFPGRGEGLIAQAIATVRLPSA